MQPDGNYIGRLQELVQKATRLGEKTPMPNYREVKQPKGGGAFSYEVTACGQTAQGAEAKQSKQAKQSAAKALLDTLLGGGVEEKAVVGDDYCLSSGLLVKKVPAAELQSKLKKAVVANKELAAAVPRSRVEVWARCLRPPGDEDYVKQLKIFSLNSATGSPKYQVNNIESLNKIVSKVEVFCTWNQFYLCGRGETKSEAEQAAAGLMLAKVREVCGLGPLVPAAPLKASWTAKAPVKAPPGPPGLAAALARVTARPELEPVQALEEAAHQLGGDGPEYSIAGVENVGLTVTVTVSCSWRGLAVPGRAPSKRLAEVAAARAMMDTLRQLEEAPGPADEADQGEEEDSSKQYCCFPPGGKASVTVTRKDYTCLKNEEFLNDVIIDFYLKYLQNGLFAHDASMQDRTHIFSIYFYNRLTQKPKTRLSVNAPPISPAERRFNNVKKWTKNINIFEKDYVIVPINDNDHWYVVMICYPGLLGPRTEPGRVEQPVILLLDSLEDGAKDEVVAVLRDWLTCEWREKMVAGGLAEVRLFLAADMPHYCPLIPQQPNLTDCGLYLLEYVEAFFRSPVTDFSVPLGSLAEWFSAEQVDGKRAAIAELIQQLAKEQNPGQSFAFPDLGFGQAQPEEQKPGPVPSDAETVQQRIKINLKPKPAGEPAAGWGKRLSGAAAGGGEGPKKAKISAPS